MDSSSSHTHTQPLFMTVTTHTAGSVSLHSSLIQSVVTQVLLIFLFHNIQFFALYCRVDVQNQPHALKEL